MQTPFNCAVCGQLVDPRLAHPACSQTCGSEQCKATYYRQCIKVFDQHRQQQRIKEFQQRGFDMVTCAICNRQFEMIGYKHLKTQRNQFMIRLNAESKKRFRKITSKFEIPGMQYKLI